MNLAIAHTIKPNLNEQFQCEPKHPGQLTKREKAADISQGALKCVIGVPNGLSAEEQQPVRNGTNTKKITDTHTFQDSASTNNNISVMSYTGDNLHKYAHCPKSFAEEAELASHQLTHEQKRRHQCSYCSKAFKCKSHLTDHLRIHTGERPFACKKCSKTFTQASALRSHTQTHIKRPFLCFKCERTFKFQRDLQQHLTQKHSKDENELNGITCSKPEPKENSELKICFKCRHCEKFFSNLCHLDEHLKSHSVRNTCSDSSNSNSDLIPETGCHSGQTVAESNAICVPSQKDEPVVIRLSTCKDDDVDQNLKTGGTESSLQNISKVEDSSVECVSANINCDIASKMFNVVSTNEEIAQRRETNESLKIRIIQKNQQSEKRRKKVKKLERPYKCRFCEKAFKCSSHLSEHLRIHTGERPFECKLCHKKFIQSSGLTNHRRARHCIKRDLTSSKSSESDRKRPRTEKSSTNEMRRFSCSHCAKKFKTRGHLKDHERIHTGERPFQCMDCPKAFRQASALKKHCLIHTGERPFLCRRCHKSFTQSQHLKNHSCSPIVKTLSLNGYTVEKFKYSAQRSPFSCSLCDQVLENSDELEKHVCCQRPKKSKTCKGGPLEGLKQQQLQRQLEQDDLPHQQQNSQEEEFKHQPQQQQMQEKGQQEQQQEIQPLDKQRSNSYQHKQQQEQQMQHQPQEQIQQDKGILHSKQKKNQTQQYGKKQAKQERQNLLRPQREEIEHQRQYSQEQQAGEHEQQYKRINQKLQLEDSSIGSLKSLTSINNQQHEPLNLKKTIKSTRILNNKDQDSSSLNHTPSDSDQRFFVCRLCNKSFRTSRMLNSHLHSHEFKPASLGISQPAPRGQFTCARCDETFLNFDLLADHIRAHAFEKPFQCKHCPKFFKRASALRKHSQIHKFRCKQCHELFSQFSEWKGHKCKAKSPGSSEVIGSLILYKCEHCDKCFKTRSHLAEHLQIHTG